MALCECGAEIRDQDKFCPQCGKPVEKKIVKPPELQPDDKPSKNVKLTNSGHVVLIIIGILLLIAAGAQLNMSKNSSSTQSTPATPATSKTVTTETKVENWQYEEKEDKIHNSKYKIARCKSANTFNFSFPYGGIQHAYLIVRQNYDGSKDAMIIIEKGQFMTSVLGGKALVRFDDNSPENYSLLPPKDGSTTTVFIKYADAFISALEKSKKIYVQTDIYNEGNPTMEFNVDGFKLQ